jgi:hypothetical protein
MNWSNSTLVGIRPVYPGSRVQVEVRSLNPKHTHAFAVKDNPSSIQRSQISGTQAEIGCNALLGAIEFVAMVIAWSVARIFRCGKLGKMTWKQFCSKYRPC